MRPFSAGSPCALLIGSVGLDTLRRALQDPEA